MQDKLYGRSRAGELIEVMRTSEVASELGISRAGVYKNRHLVRVQIGAYHYFTAASVQAWLETLSDSTSLRPF